MESGEGISEFRLDVVSGSLNGRGPEVYPWVEMLANLEHHEPELDLLETLGDFVDEFENILLEHRIPPELETTSCSGCDLGEDETDSEDSLSVDIWNSDGKVPEDH